MAALIKFFILFVLRHVRIASIDNGSLIVSLHFELSVSDLKSVFRVYLYRVQVLSFSISSRLLITQIEEELPHGIFVFISKHWEYWTHLYWFVILLVFLFVLFYWVQIRLKVADILFLLY